METQLRHDMRGATLLRGRTKLSTADEVQLQCVVRTAGALSGSADIVYELTCVELLYSRLSACQ